MLDQELGKFKRYFNDDIVKFAHHLQYSKFKLIFLETQQ